MYLKNTIELWIYNLDKKKRNLDAYLISFFAKS